MQMNLEALGDFPLPPVASDDATFFNDNTAGAERIGVLQQQPAENSCGVVITQKWHGEGGLRVPAWYSQFHNITYRAGMLAARGMVGAFHAVGVETSIVTLPSIDDQPPSTLAAITYPDTQTFCDRGTEVIQAEPANANARLIADYSPLMSFGAQLRTEDAKSEQLRISGGDENGDDLFFYHDWAIHGLTWILLARIPAITADLSAQAAAALGKDRHRFSSDQVMDFSGRSDAGISTTAILEVLDGKLSWQWNELWRGELKPEEGAELVRHQLGVMAVTNFDELVPQPI